MPRIAGLISIDSRLSKITFDKSIFYFLFVALTFLITCRVLLITLLNPIQIILEYVYEGLIGVYILYRLTKRVFEKNWRINALEGLMMLVFILPFLAGLSAYLRFDQPMVYGVGTFRDFYLIYGGLIIYNMLRTGEIDIKLVERALVGVAWFNLVFYYSMSLLTNPADYVETGVAGANDLKGDDVFYRFNMIFMFFGTLYYSIKGVMRNKLIYLFYAALFLIYIVFFRIDRTVIMVTLGALGAFLLFTSPVKRTALYVIRFGIPLLLVFLLSYFIAPEIYDRYILMLADVFDTVAASSSSGESDNVRLVELQVALTGIQDNPWFGNGKVSTKWVEGGYNYFFGYFYASDLGLIGLLYIYGIIGTAILYLQFPFALWYTLKIKVIKRDVFLLALQYLMLALFVDSLSNGYPGIYAAQTFICVILIFYYYQLDLVKRKRIPATAIEDGSYD